MLNCANCPEPDLRGLLSLFHRFILMDEASPKMVIAQKKLFQCPATEVLLGCSTTNCHAYEVFVSGIGMIVCSNTWSEEIATMSPADQDWLAANSIYMKVSSPLFVVGALA